MRGGEDNLCACVFAEGRGIKVTDKHQPCERVIIKYHKYSM